MITIGLKRTLDPSVLKVVIIAILIFIEGFSIPAYTVTQQGRKPTDVEWMGFLFAALIQFVTYLLTFLGFNQTHEEKPPTH